MGGGALADVAERAAALAAYIRGLDDFTVVERQAPHGHMGATIAEAVLQAGMRYEAQVAPRVRRILRDFPEATTSTRFLAALGDDPGVVVGIRGRKAGYVRALAVFLAGEGLEEEAQLLAWLGEPGSTARLREIRGVGPKTVSYLRLLVGGEEIAVDVRVRSFLAAAGVATDSYEDAAAVVAGAAAILGVAPSALDASIWRYVGGVG